MNKEKYITPDVEAFEVKDTDIIRTSIFEQNSADELERVDESFFAGTAIEDLFN